MSAVTFCSCINLKLTNEKSTYLVSEGFLKNEIFLKNISQDKNIDLTFCNFKILPFSYLNSPYYFQNLIKKKLIDNLKSFNEESINLNKLNVFYIKKKYIKQENLKFKI